MPDVDFRQFFPKPPDISPATHHLPSPDLIDEHSQADVNPFSKKRRNRRGVWIYVAFAIAALLGTLAGILRVGPSAERFRAGARRSPNEFLYPRPLSAPDNVRTEKAERKSTQEQSSDSISRVAASTATAEKFWHSSDEAFTNPRPPYRSPNDVNPLPQPALNSNQTQRSNVAVANRSAASHTASRAENQAKSSQENQVAKGTKTSAMKDRHVQCAAIQGKSAHAEKAGGHSLGSKSTELPRATAHALDLKSNRSIDSMRTNLGLRGHDMANPRGSSAMPNVCRPEMSASGPRR